MTLDPDLYAERTVRPAMVRTALCEHCGSSQTHVFWEKQPNGKQTPGHACLQCIADGGTCCSLAPLKRWRS